MVFFVAFTTIRLGSGIRNQPRRLTKIPILVLPPKSIQALIFRGVRQGTVTSEDVQQP